MRKLYAERRVLTVAGLERVLGERMHIDAQPGRMHLILRLRDRQSDHQLVARMRQDGLYAEALSDWMGDENEASAVILNFTNIDSQRSAEILASRLLPLI